MLSYLRALKRRVAKKLGNPLGVYNNGRVKLIFDSEQHRRDIEEYAEYFNHAVEQGFIEINGGCEVNTSRIEEAGACPNCFIELINTTMAPGDGAVMRNFDIYNKWHEEGKY